METITPRDGGLPDAEPSNAETYRLGKLIGLDDDTLRIILDVPAVGSKAASPKTPVDLTTAEWHQLKCFLPHNALAAPGASPRLLLNALLYRARHSSASWRSLPPHYGPGDMVAQKFRRWLASGALDRLLGALPDLDLSPERRQEFEALRRQIAQAEARAAD